MSDKIQPVTDPVESLAVTIEVFHNEVECAFETYIVQDEVDRLPAALTPDEAKWVGGKLDEVSQKTQELLQLLSEVGVVLAGAAKRINPDLRHLGSTTFYRPDDPEWEELKALMGGS